MTDALFNCYSCGAHNVEYTHVCLSPDERHHRKILAAPFVAMLDARDYIFRQRDEWTVEVRLAVSDMLLEKAYAISIEQELCRKVGGRP